MTPKYQQQSLGSLENSVLDLKQLLKTPSSQKGYSSIKERDIRILICNNIDAASIILELPQNASATAQVLVQRFYFMVSIGDFPLVNVMGAAIYLACKLEEQPRRLRDIITCLDYIQKRANGLPETTLQITSNIYYTLREGLLTAEINILSKLGFNVHVEHPHGFLLHYLSGLELSNNHELCQSALNYLHDSYRTIACCLYQPHTIAAAVIYMAAKACNVELVQTPPWYEIFESEKQDLELISDLVNELYRIAKLSLTIPNKVPLRE